VLGATVNINRLGAALLAGLGAGFGWILYRAVAAFPHYVGGSAHQASPLAFSLQLVILSIFVLSFAKPIEHIVQRWSEPLFQANSNWPAVAWRVALACLIIVLEMLVDRVDHTRSA
jgi:hypothetical protein